MIDHHNYSRILHVKGCMPLSCLNNELFSSSFRLHFSFLNFPCINSFNMPFSHIYLTTFIMYPYDIYLIVRILTRKIEQ